VQLRGVVAGFAAVKLPVAVPAQALPTAAVLRVALVPAAAQAVGLLGSHLNPALPEVLQVMDSLLSVDSASATTME
jgi:hypothetical protein